MSLYSRKTKLVEESVEPLNATPGATARTVTRSFVLGAGLGTRLRPLTESRPKPLVPVAGKPLIAYAFDHLIDAGIERIVVNTHHRAEVYARFFPENTHRGLPLVFRHEPVLLETGGGIKNVEDLLGDEPFIVYNGDILTTLPLQPAIDHHFAAGNEVTLVLRSGGGPLQIAYDPKSGRVLDIGNRLGCALGTHLFTGIYVVNPAFLRRLRLEKASVVPAFTAMISEEAALGGIVLDEGNWWDLGTRDQYLEVHRALRAVDPQTAWIHPDAILGPEVKITGSTFIGPGAEIGANAELHDSILWDGTRIAKESVLHRCIVTDGQSVSGVHSNEDF